MVQTSAAEQLEQLATVQATQDPATSPYPEIQEVGTARVLSQVFNPSTELQATQAVPVRAGPFPAEQRVQPASVQAKQFSP
jgi:hypothetical protein